MMKGSNKELVLFGVAGMLFLFMFLPLSFASSTHVNVAVDTSELCEYSHLNVNIAIHYPYDAVRAKLKVYVDGEYERTLHVYEGDRYNFYLVLDDLDEGEHELYIKYYIYNGEWFNDYLVDDGSVSVPFYVDCDYPTHYYYTDTQEVNNILLYANKREVEIGEIVRVYGYVDAYRDVKVKFYLNGAYKGKVITNNGFFEKYLLIEKQGENKIKVKAGDKSKSIYIYAEQEQVQEEEEQESEYQYMEQDQEGDVNIVIHNGNVRIYYAGSNKTSSQNNNNQDHVKYEYVDVKVSTKQLDMEEGKGNLIKVKVLNHMNESKLFSVSTSLEDKYVYLPSPKVLGVKEEGEFDIYLKPSIEEEGSNRIEATIYVYMNNNEIKEIPIDIFIIKRRYQERQEQEGGFLNLNLSAYEFAGLLVLFLLVLASLYTLPTFMGKKEGMLKPKYFEGTQEVN